MSNDSFDKEVAALIRSARETERTKIAIWMRAQNAASECGPFALHNASHVVESGSYLESEPRHD